MLNFRQYRLLSGRIMMQLPKLTSIPFLSLPPLHTWPQPLKRVILGIATVVCFSAYFLLVIGIISLVVTLILR
jgi:hypothetical protein